MAAIPDDAVDQLHPFADLRWGDSMRLDREVLQLVGALDIGIRTDVHVLDDPAGLDHGVLADDTIASPAQVLGLAGQFNQPFHQALVLAIGAPQPCIGADKVLERKHRAPLGLVHDAEPNAHILALALHDHAHAGFAVVGRIQFVDLAEDAPLADDVVGHIGTAVNGAMAADIA
ncbi:hypothetical protein SDC9_191948 [bioreactor metagenome]|uniref:Uncharacterized protein n=1 Tax=bioreactor metagenome TaxID=1076179 RepID=A0A645IAD5_9ZZZZ